MRMGVVFEGVTCGDIDADIVVREFAHLYVIYTEDLGLLVTAHAASGDVVHDPKNDGGHHERVGQAGH